MASIFLLIVMLNLLIAIISDTFERVQEQANSIMYKSMSELIYENQYLLRKSVIENFNKEAGTYLLIASPERNSSEGEGNAWEGKIHALKNSMNARHIEMTDFLLKLKEGVSTQNEKMEGKVGTLETKVNRMSKDLGRIEKKLDLYFSK